jgi:hypothetical protein
VPCENLPTGAITCQAVRKCAKAGKLYDIDLLLKRLHDEYRKLAYSVFCPRAVFEFTEVGCGVIKGHSNYAIRTQFCHRIV